MNKYCNRCVLTLSILFLNNHCYSYFEIKDKPLFEKANSLPGSKKVIALVGFNDYEYVIKYSDFRRSTRTTFSGSLMQGRNYRRPVRQIAAFSRSNKDFLNLFGIGKDLATIPFHEDYPKQIDYHMLANHKFIESEFSEKTSQSDMLYELVFASKYLKIQKDKIDYYVVAINYYPYQTSTALGWISMALTFFPSFVTFNLIPIVDHQKSYTKFLIYGKNLELLNELEISNNYLVFHSVWQNEKHPCFLYNREVLPGFRPQPACIWESNLKTGQDFVKEFIKEDSKAK
ncbi:hypothetical protein EHQ90_05500 [Leptospira stimsonii]|uniref:Lipoprotein n=2 Tax=Leptospira stimsonii TaxID=2202203 RepID=A0ABY2N9H4_9LEPT|nr:hypothetical protein [Leptospira stimsonii]TGM18978.1 hypothetical protein EHQ90_05500 [Leptospira stimsonii]